jgi:hypothetical protein
MTGSTDADAMGAQIYYSNNAARNGLSFQALYNRDPAWVNYLRKNPGIGSSNVAFKRYIEVRDALLVPARQAGPPAISPQTQVLTYIEFLNLLRRLCVVGRLRYGSVYFNLLHSMS